MTYTGLNHGWHFRPNAQHAISVSRVERLTLTLALSLTLALTLILFQRLAKNFYPESYLLQSIIVGSFSRIHQLRQQTTAQEWGDLTLGLSHYF